MRITAAVLTSMLAANALVAQEATKSSAALQLFVKGSTAYATPTNAPLKSALLAISSHSPGIQITNRNGARLELAMLTIVLSNLEIGCETYRSKDPAKLATVSTDQDYIALASVIDLYPTGGNWNTTTIGGAFAEGSTATRAEFHEYTVSTHHLALKKKVNSKRVEKNAPLVLERVGAEWQVTFATPDKNTSVEANVPLKFCGIDI